MNKSEAKRKFESLSKHYYKIQQLQDEIVTAYPIFEEGDNIAVLSYPDDFPESAFSNVINHGVIYDHEVKKEEHYSDSEEYDFGL